MELGSRTGPGTIKKKHTSEITFKGYTVHASKEEPQYLIKSDKTDHLAMHKGSALQKIAKSQGLSGVRSWAFMRLLVDWLKASRHLIRTTRRVLLDLLRLVGVMYRSRTRCGGREPVLAQATGPVSGT